MTTDYCLETTVDNEGILTVYIDVQHEAMNVFNQQTMDAFYELVASVEHDPTIKAIIFISKKPDCFIAGADINMLQTTNNAEEASSIVHKAHNMLQTITQSKKPFIAAIDGVCLGAGYELALACQYRIATDSPTTTLGLPEVNIGLLPGATGTTKLPHLVSLPSALNIMLTGRPLSSRRAKALGMIDDVVPPVILLKTAKKIARAILQKKWQRKKLPLMQRMMRLPVIGNIIIHQARKKVLKKTKGLYPAPLTLLDVVQYGLNKPIATALAFEAKKFGELSQSPQAKQLMGLYFATTELKKETFISDEITPSAIQSVGILGGGLMGTGIATVSIAKANARVRMKEISDSSLLNAYQHVHRYYQTQIKRHKLSKEQAQKKIHQFSGTVDDSGLAACDLIIEAVFEDLAVKRDMVKNIEALGNEKSIFASNTSSIPISDIAYGAQRPENIIGMHYFSPVEKMPLLEIITHAQTSETTIASAVEFGRRQGKTVIVVKDSPGFYVNRILTPYLNAALKLGMNGVAFDHIDKALMNFGFPIGPFKLLDEIGLDIANKILPILEDAFGKRMAGCGAQTLLLEKGRLGKKVKKGFYSYHGKHRGIDTTVYSDLNVTPNNTVEDTDIIDACVTPLIEEAQRCLDEGVVASERDGNIGAIYGIGFPPFLGGPFQYAQHNRLID